MCSWSLYGMVLTPHVTHGHINSHNKDRFRPGFDGLFLVTSFERINAGGLYPDASARKRHPTSKSPEFQATQMILALRCPDNIHQLPGVLVTAFTPADGFHTEMGKPVNRLTTCHRLVSPIIDHPVVKSGKVRVTLRFAL